ncbi:unnamed protein product, partial [Prorocentrum cordatum]
EVSWSWLEMVAQMGPETRAQVASGPDGCSGGLVRCVVSARPKSCDHQRCFASWHHRGDERGEHQDNYDFVIYRKDFSVVRFHPNWKSKDFDLCEADPRASAVPPPRDGCGGSNCACTCKYCKHIDRAGTGRVDRERGDGMPPGDLGYQSGRD